MAGGGGISVLLKSLPHVALGHYKAIVHDILEFLRILLSVNHQGCLDL